MSYLQRTLIMLWCLLIPCAALATDTSVKTAVNEVAVCVHDRNAQACRNTITASSLGLFNRFVSYDLMDCLPQSAAYLSQKAEGTAMQVRATITTNDKKTIVRLIFQQEEDQWKLDIPETLRRGMGDNWEGQLNATEQVYLMLRSQMGDKLNCTMIRNLGTGLTATKSQ